MSPYTIQYTPRADRDLEKLPRETAQKVIRAIHNLREDPYHAIKKIKACNPIHPIYSFRAQRDIRVLLSIHNEILIIHILEVEHRKHSYRDF
jgi:mRNA interferase RelE/StbE